MPPARVGTVKRKDVLSRIAKDAKVARRTVARVAALLKLDDLILKYRAEAEAARLDGNSRGGSGKSSTNWAETPKDVLSRVATDAETPTNTKGRERIATPGPELL